MFYSGTRGKAVSSRVGKGATCPMWWGTQSVKAFRGKRDLSSSYSRNNSHTAPSSRQVRQRTRVGVGMIPGNECLYLGRELHLRLLQGLDAWLKWGKYRWLWKPVRSPGLGCPEVKRPPQRGSRFSGRLRPNRSGASVARPSEFSNPKFGLQTLQVVQVCRRMSIASIIMKILNSQKVHH